MTTFNNIGELLDSLDSDYYDTDAMRTDYRNNNLDLDNPNIDSYYMANIVAESVINGQFTQARKQFSKYGLHGSELLGLLTPEDILKIIN